MEASETQALVSELDQLKHRARADRRGTSLPLLVFGAITLVGALLPVEAISNWMFAYWILAIPVGFGTIAWLQRRHAAETGIGEGAEPYHWFALGFPLLFLVPLGFLVVMMPLLAIAAGLVFVAVRQRNRYLGVCAAVFGVVGTLEMSFATMSNRLYDLTGALGLFEDAEGYFNWSEQLVVGLLAAFLLGAGLLARRRELRAA